MVATLPPTVLLTGFGPFPKVPENATSVLVPALAAAARQQFTGMRLHAEILPTEWASAPARLDELMREWSPSLVLQFGVSPRAKGFVFETRARNERDVKSVDATGCPPPAAAIAEDGADILRSGLPVAELVRRLRSLGLPAVRSHNAGKYICNALLYHGLARLPQIETVSGNVPLVGFVHLPTDIPARPAPKLSQSELASGPDPQPKYVAHSLTMKGALAGGLAIIATCLEVAAREKAAGAKKPGDGSPG
jgi:pyroglutamyl-peptidase